MPFAPNVTQKHGAFYLRSKGEWIHLGRDLDSAQKKYDEIVGAEGPHLSVRALVNHYRINELPLKSEATRRTYDGELTRIARALGHHVPDQLESHHCYSYWSDHGRNEARRKEIRTLGAVLTYGRQRGFVKVPNVTHQLRIPKYKARTRYVTDAEYDAVRKIALGGVRVSTRAVAAGMRLMRAIGQRCGDVLKLRLAQISDDGIDISQSKTGKRLVIEWDDELRAAVDEALALDLPTDRLYLITNSKGEPYGDQEWNHLWRRVMEKAMAEGVEDFMFRDLRAKKVTDLIEQSDGDIEPARRLAGHSDARITNRVYNRRPDRVSAVSQLRATVRQHRKSGSSEAA